MADPERPIIWSPDALTDFSEVWDYIANTAGRQTADNIVRGIHDTSRLLEGYPLAGRARPEVRPDLRSVAARPYVVFYRVTNDAVEIVRLLDGRRDLDEIFADSPNS